MRNKQNKFEKEQPPAGYAVKGAGLMTPSPQTTTIQANQTAH
jgi:hypothetical protein